MIRQLESEVFSSFSHKILSIEKRAGLILFASTAVRRSSNKDYQDLPQEEKQGKVLRPPHDPSFYPCGFDDCFYCSVHELCDAALERFQRDFEDMMKEYEEIEKKQVEDIKAEESRETLHELQPIDQIAMKDEKEVEDPSSSEIEIKEEEYAKLVEELAHEIKED